MVVGHITNLDVVSMIPSGIALLVGGILIGGALGPRLVRKVGKR